MRRYVYEYNIIQQSDMFFDRKYCRDKNEKDKIVLRPPNVL